MLRLARSWPRESPERRQRRQTAASLLGPSENEDWIDAHTIFLARTDVEQRDSAVDPVRSGAIADRLRGELRGANSGPGNKGKCRLGDHRPHGPTKENYHVSN